ncbi:hypothetical protein [Aquidulcibacter paucihalophilus]|uniref:hypothetical protein n=1 Tax=Aquidulcibacter paucihalophilus TaxID=1978549 RepID=UPI000A18E222|nr:hypothetical protein [Aquidulcibacter paucihalophilus]
METIFDIGRRITKLSAEARKAWEATDVAARAEEIHLCEAVPSALMLGESDLFLRIPHADDLGRQYGLKIYSERHVDAMRLILAARTDPNRSDITHVGKCEISKLSEAAIERIKKIVAAGAEWQANTKRAQLLAEHDRLSEAASAIEERLSVLQRLVVDMPATTPEGLAVKAKALQACYAPTCTLKEASDAIQACDESLAGKITASIIRDLQTFIDQAA